MSQKDDHQDQVCEFVAQIMSRRKKDNLVLAARPDRDERGKKAIDYLYRGEKGEFALEHTLIESVPDEIPDRIQITNLLEPLRAELSGKLPGPDYYELGVNVGAAKGIKKPGKVQGALKTWVTEKAPTLRIPKDECFCSIQETPPGVPFEVTLFRYRCQSGAGELYYGRIFPHDLEAQRRQRIKKALKDKCPKLSRAKAGKEGRTSVLVIEDKDFQLTNAGLIGHPTVEEVANLENDVPDEVYLVRTGIENAWRLWILKEGDIKCPAVPDHGPHRRQEN